MGEAKIKEHRNLQIASATLDMASIFTFYMAAKTLKPEEVQTLIGISHDRLAGQGLPANVVVLTCDMVCDFITNMQLQMGTAELKNKEDLDA